MLCIRVSHGRKKYGLTIAINVETTNHVEYVTDYLCRVKCYRFMETPLALADKLNRL